MKVGITGHQDLANPAWVKAELIRLLRVEDPPLAGISSLAVGADQLFADAVLECGGKLQVIVPFEGYAASFDEQGRREYERLVNRASRVEVLPDSASEEEAYLAAGKLVVDSSDWLIAVWDGRPAGGTGGTADIVDYARRQRKRYVHVNPVTDEGS